MLVLGGDSFGGRHECCCSGRFRGPINGKLLASPPPPPTDESRRPNESCASRRLYGDHGKILLLPPPLNRVDSGRSRGNSATTPPPLNRVDDLALHTKGAAPLGKSWICDCVGPLGCLVDVLRPCTVLVESHSNVLCCVSHLQYMPVDVVLGDDRRWLPCDSQ